MTERICIGLAFISCFVLITWASILSNRYRKQGEVVRANRNEIVFEDANGNLWAIDYEQGYKVGDKVLITFDSQGTWDCVEDDEIISVSRQRA